MKLHVSVYLSFILTRIGKEKIKGKKDSYSNKGQKLVKELMIS
jgi:hypothetical protein